LVTLEKMENQDHVVFLDLKEKMVA